MPAKKDRELKIPEGKLPPQNIEAEQSVLGALMLDKDAIIKVVDILEPGDFYRTDHQKIYEAIQEIFAKNQPIDILSVSNRLREKEILEEVGGMSYLVSLVNQVPTATHAAHYANIVHKKRVLRDLISVSRQIEALGWEEEKEVDKILDEAEQKLFQVSQRMVGQMFRHIKGDLEEAFERMDKLHKGGGETLRGIPTGFSLLDQYLSGLQKSDLIILAARPSLGKTAFALDIARHVALKSKVAVGIFSLEMSREQLIDRLIAAESSVDLWKLRTGRLKDEGDPSDFELVEDALARLAEAPLFIDDTASPTVFQMRTMARRLQAETNLGLIIVDYLQLIQPHIKSDNVVQQITEISRSLKALAKELQVPVLAISQLSRAVEQRSPQIPKLSDLRESGCLTGDTCIMRADTGELLSMEELAKRETQTPIPVFTLNNEWKLSVRPMVKVFSSGRKQVYALKTKTGRIIKASANHPFKKLDGWYRLDQLRIGDKIATPRQISPRYPQDILSNDEIILLAHLLGDGCTVPRQPIHYTSADPENINIVRETAERLFSIKSRLVPQKNWWHLYLPSPYRLTRGKHHPITNWLTALGIGLRHSFEKEIPAAMFLCSEEKISLFLRHLWATDGNISWKVLRGRMPSANIYYSTTSERLSFQVQHLLLRLGIQAVRRTVYEGNHRPLYGVVIQGKDNQLQFLKRVGCAGSRGKIIPELISALEKITANPNTDVIPKEAWQLIVAPAKAAVGIGWRELSERLGMSYCGSTLFQSGLSRIRLDKVARICENAELKQLAASDVYWDEIKEIVPLGVREVYDATVADTHNFVANDIIVHNSLEQDADVVLFIYRPDRDKPDSAERNIAEIRIAKHRNGPLGQVPLYFDEQRVTFREIEKREEELSPEFVETEEL